jgi:hypothetical protein
VSLLSLGGVGPKWPTAPSDNAGDAAATSTADHSAAGCRRDSDQPRGRRRCDRRDTVALVKDTVRWQVATVEAMLLSGRA